MEVVELRKKTVEELNGELFVILEDQFKLRMQASSGQEIQKTHLFKKNRRNIARIKTILKEKMGN